VQFKAPMIAVCYRYGQSGLEAPNLKPEIVPTLIDKGNVWRVKRFQDKNGVRFWDWHHLYHPWNRRASHFNFID